MRAVVQRVSEASVSVGGEVVGEIHGPGLMVLVGVTHDDDRAKAAKLAAKLWGLRVLHDEKSCSDLDAPLLVISQFTLYGDCSHGRRPNFLAAAGPDLAVPLYEQFLAECERLGFPPQHGQFGAYMQVSSVNDGPVTMIVDTKDLK